MPRFSGVDSEVGRLRAVIVHRPGAELKRVVPRTGRQLPFAGLLARGVFDAGLAHTVLVVPPAHPDRRLDTACTMLDGGTVLMRPAAAYSLTARVLTPGGDGPRVSHPRAFLAAAAAAAGLDRSAQPVLPGEQGSCAARRRLIHRTLRMRSA